MTRFILRRVDQSAKIIGALVFGTLASSQASGQELQPLDVPLGGFSDTAFCEGRLLIQHPDLDTGSSRVAVDVWELGKTGYVRAGGMPSLAVPQSLQSFASYIEAGPGVVISAFPLFPDPDVVSGHGSLRIWRIDEDLNVTGTEWVRDPFEPGSGFATAIAYDRVHQRVAIGAPRLDVGGRDQVGAVAIYDLSGATAEHVATLSPGASILAADPSLALFGGSLAFHDGCLFAGTSSVGGRVLVWELGPNGSYVFRQILAPPVGVPAAFGFGGSLAFDGQQLAVSGGGGGFTAPGSVAFFRRDVGAGDWVRGETLVSPVGAGASGQFDTFGTAIEFSGEDVVVSTPNASGVGQNTGALSVFEKGPVGRYEQNSVRVLRLEGTAPGGFSQLGVGLNAQDGFLAARIAASNTGSDGVHMFAVGRADELCASVSGGWPREVRMYSHEAIAPGGSGPAGGVVLSRMPARARYALFASTESTSVAPTVALGAAGLCLQRPVIVGIGQVSGTANIEVRFGADLSPVWTRLRVALDSVALQAFLAAPGTTPAWSGAFVVRLGV